jgi:uncharacterized membrane protein
MTFFWDNKFHSWSTWLAGIVTLMILDGIWLGWINRNTWSRQIQQIQNGVPVTFRPQWALIPYILLLVMIIWCVLPGAEMNTTVTSSQTATTTRERVLWYGFLAGFIVYGVFDGTMMAIFQQYQWSVALMDWAWGSILCCILAGTMYQAWLAHH